MSESIHVCRTDSLISCPFCESQIPALAKKCRYCGETIDYTMRSVEDLKRNQQQLPPPLQPTVFLNAGIGSSPDSAGLSCAETRKATRNFHWTSMASLGSGLFVFMGACTEPEGKWDTDSVAGVAVLSFIPIIFGIISLASNHEKRWMAVTGLIFGVLVFLMAMGSM